MATPRSERPTADPKAAVHTRMISRGVPGRHFACGRPRDAGYILVALVAGLTIALVLASAAIPNLLRDVQREREEEMLFRGQQVVDALERYFRATNRYPSSLEELAEGVVVRGSTRRLHFVRPSALVDPMTNERWAVLRPGDAAVRRFIQAYLKSVGQPANPMLLQFISPGGRIALPGRPSPRASTSGQRPSGLPVSPTQLLAQPGAEPDLDLFRAGAGPDDQDQATGPVIGVVSRSDKKAIRVFYDLESYRDWAFLFIPDPLLPPAIGQARIKTLLSPIIYPSDPLRRLPEGMLRPARMQTAPAPQRPAVVPDRRR